MERLHIAFFGPTNSGKSTLVNAICGQEVSLVSPIPGTTTDPVRKTIELPGLGPCVLIDTAGLDDTGLLGAERQRRTHAVLDETDIAVVLPMSQNEGHRAQKTGESASDVPDIGTLLSRADIPVVYYTRGESVDSLLRRIAAARPAEEERFLTGDLVQAGDTVLLVMPQDSEAPKGRLILPQVQVIRELLDRGCNPLCCTPDSLQQALASLKDLPALTITDSQVFGFVNSHLPAACPLTSFSILLAAAKGDVAVFVEGAQAIDRLTSNSRVLIAEACTHVPDTEDIGRVKIPAMLRKRAAGLRIDIAAGNDFPEDLSPYDLIIHCGACVAGRQVVRARTRKALLSGVPITNYGIALAYLQGILDRIVIPGPSRRT
ncbi:MAG: 50S ribosome-binding GTPase [Bacteroidales bacterium]|nr:50S ribosome-binding GTPase [Bacteroidales bacterium]